MAVAMLGCLPSPVSTVPILPWQRLCPSLERELSVSEHFARGQLSLPNQSKGKDSSSRNWCCAEESVL